MEMVDKDASELNLESTRAINALQKPTGAQLGETSNSKPERLPKNKTQLAGHTCYHCGGSHSPLSCRFKLENAGNVARLDILQENATQNIPFKGRWKNKHMDFMAFRQCQSQDPRGIWSQLK